MTITQCSIHYIPCMLTLLKQFYEKQEVDGAAVNHLEVTGKFVQFLLSKIPRGSVLNDMKSNQRSSDQTSTFQLYTAISFTNMELVCLIFYIFGNKFPLPFQLLQCSTSCTKEDLQLFFERVDKYPEYKYLLLGINHLSMEVQQVIIVMNFDECKHALLFVCIVTA